VGEASPLSRSFAGEALSLSVVGGNQGGPVAAIWNNQQLFRFLRQLKTDNLRRFADKEKGRPQ
jgi:hypothetical protein